MPDQPADPIHYDMKIPPEPKDRTRDDEPEKASEPANKQTNQEKDTAQQPGS
jgi:hypothetical protein